MLKLYKHMKAEHADQLHLWGRLRLGTLYEYRNIESSELQDRLEGWIHTSHVQKGSFICGQDSVLDAPIEMQRLIGLSGSGTIRHNKFTIKSYSPNRYIYCLSSTSSPVFQNYNACLEIREPQLFMDIICSQLVKHYPQVIGERNDISYSGRQRRSGDYPDPAFVKDINFQHEKEYRITFTLPKAYSKNLSPLFITDYRLGELCKRVR